MLGHQITKQEHQCTKCRHILTEPKPILTFRDNIEHTWWVMEILYWLKVDVYNKKMLKLTPSMAQQRYQKLLQDVQTLYHKNVPDFVYYKSRGQYQTNTFQNVIKPLLLWIQNRDNYTHRFQKKL
tara:strand:- start:80 stop:454 length:375 start_codon:yes stop_codon:yes gene_type:complete